MADRAHSTSRRALLAGLSASPLLTVPAASETAPTPIPTPELVTEWEVVPVPPWDGALHTREPRIRELEARADALSAEEDRIYALVKAVEPPRPHETSARFTPWLAACRARYEAMGHEAAHQAWLAADRELRAAVIALDDIPARTYAGLRMKARYAKHYQDLAHGIVEDLQAMDARARAGERLA